MTLHTISPTRETLHGHFSPDLPPILTIEPGDTVRFQTLDANWGLEPYAAADQPQPQFEPRDKEKDAGHALCGPIEIAGAEPGMTLEIRIDALRPDSWGWNWGGGGRGRWEYNQLLGAGEGDPHLLMWTLDTDAMLGRNQHGHSVALQPFLGVMGVAPPEAGTHSTGPPRLWGGNLDCKELIQGASLFLPIGVPGANFSTGDGHAAQGDGEVSGTAIECPMAQADLTFFLHPGRHATPRAKTPAAWLTLGLDEDLDQAMRMALNAMLDLITEKLGVSRKDALALASVAVDLRITQVVNGVQGVHALLPHGVIR